MGTAHAGLELLTRIPESLQAALGDSRHRVFQTAPFQKGKEERVKEESQALILRLCPGRFMCTVP